VCEPPAGKTTLHLTKAQTVNRSGCVRVGIGFERHDYDLARVQKNDLFEGSEIAIFSAATATDHFSSVIGKALSMFEN
jgi:hypothetical protein